jgi:hypothetical protein
VAEPSVQSRAYRTRYFGESICKLTTPDGSKGSRQIPSLENDAKWRKTHKMSKCCGRESNATFSGKFQFSSWCFYSQLVVKAKTLVSLVSK